MNSTITSVALMVILIEQVVAVQMGGEQQPIKTNTLLLLVVMVAWIATAAVWDITHAIREGHHANPDLAPRPPCTPEQHRARFGDPRSD